MQSRNDALIAMEEFPKHRYFQLFVDGSMHVREQGDKGFESREPGCMSAFYNAFDFALKNIDKKLDLEFIFKIHALVSENVSGNFNNTSAGKFRNGPIKPFRVPYPRNTKEGIKSFMAAAQKANIGELKGNSTRGHELVFNSNDNFVQRLLEADSISPDLVFQPPFLNESDVRARAEFLLKEYDENISKARAEGDNDKIIKAIAHFVRFMELLHPFNDANGRVFVNIILNYLLIQNNLLPATFFEPNIFDIYSDDELVEAIKDGMSHTLFTIKYPDEQLFGYTPPKKDNKDAEKIKDTISTHIDNRNQSVDKYLSNLELYLDNTWDQKFNFHRFCATGQISKLKQFSADEIKSNSKLIAPDSVAPLYKGLAPIHIATKMNNDVVLFLKDVDKSLINQQDDYGNTPIYYAIQNNNYLLAKILIEDGAQLQIKNKQSESPFDWAIKYAEPKLFKEIQALTNSLPFLQLPDKEKLDIIYTAVTTDNVALLEWIINDQGINLPNLMEKLGAHFGTYKDPLMFSLTGKSTKTFQFLLSHVYPNKDMPFSIFEKYLSKIVEGRDVNLFDFAFAYTDLKSKVKPIDSEILIKVLAKQYNDFRMPYQLIELEKDNIANVKDDIENAPLILLIAPSVSKEVLVKLIEAGVDPNTSMRGETLLSLAARYERLDIIEYLVETLKIDPDFKPPPFFEDSNSVLSFFYEQKPKEALTPLAVAVQAGKLESVKLLLNLGAKVNDQVKEALSKCNNHTDEIGSLISKQMIKFE